MNDVPVTRITSLVDELAALPWVWPGEPHSSGGIIGAELARLAPDRVNALLAVSAVLPRPGASFLSSMPFPNRILLSAVMRFAGTRPPVAAIRRGVGAGLDEGVVDRLIADVVPESIGLYRGRASDGRLPARRGYVMTARDEELPAAVQQRFADDFDAPWQESLATGHLPMLEAPESLAEVIARFLDRTP